MSGPRVFGSSHLSEDAVAAFADGVLSPSATDRARRHCIDCGECAEAVRCQRETALLLRGSGVPSVPSGLLARLSGVPMSAPLPPSGGVPMVIGTDGVPMFQSHQSPSRRQSSAIRSESASTDARKNDFVRKAILPVGIVASAAALVAAGTIGSGPMNKPTRFLPASITGITTGDPASSVSTPAVPNVRSATPSQASPSQASPSQASPVASSSVTSTHP